MKFKYSLLLLPIILTSCTNNHNESITDTLSEIISESLSGYSESESEYITEIISDSFSGTINIDDYWTNSDYKDYYNDINFELTGKELLKALQTLNNKKHTTHLTYKSLWDYFKYTDYDPNNTKQYIAFYKGTSAKQEQMNKEHVWPKSHGGNEVEGDLHMVRPTLTNDNSSRGNSFYVENICDTKYGWDPKEAGMLEKYRGIAARIIFYCCVECSKLYLVDTTYHYTTNANRDNQMGKLSDLLKWNLMYPVDNSELIRNNAVEKIQGNRNPFIDNPQLACQIWQDENNNTKSICSIGK